MYTYKVNGLPFVERNIVDAMKAYKHLYPSSTIRSVVRVGGNKVK